MALISPIDLFNRNRPGGVVPFKTPPVIPGSTLDYALRYAALGWQVFPVWGGLDGLCRCRGFCSSPAKHPISDLTPHGMDNATTDAAIIHHWYAQMPEAGVACYLQGSGLVAIDIDPRNGGLFTVEQLESAHGKLESDVMQYTQGGGTHLVYRIPAGMEVTLPGKLGPGVDVKVNGYIVLDPTVGIKGAYDWEASSNPLEGAIPSPLPDWIRDLGTLPTGPFSASVASRYVTEAQIEELRDALSVLPSDDRDTWVRFGLALSPLGQSGFDLWDDWSQKSSKYDPVDAIRVWRSCKPGAVNFESIFHAAQHAGWINPLSSQGDDPTFIPTRTIRVEKEPPPRQEPPLKEVPTDLLTLPVDALQQVVGWMEGYSEEPNRQISVHATLALASVLAGRIYESVNGNVSSLYLLTLAGTGIGKGYPKHAIRRLLNDARLERLLSGSGNTSAGSVFSALFRSPTHIQISDEFGKHLQAARRQASGAMADALAVLTEAYSDATGMLVPRNYSNFHLSKKELAQLDSKVVMRPAITLYAFATPEQVFDGLTTAEIDDGFLNRFVVVEVTEPCLPEQRIDAEPTPAELIAWARAMRRIGKLSGTDLEGLDTDYDMEPAPIAVRFSKDAWSRFDAFKHEIKTSQYPEPKLAMRWRENAMRLATTLAVADDPHSPVVSTSLADWAISYVRHYGEAFMLSAASKIADNDFHRLYKLVRDYIVKAGSHGMTERDLSRISRVFQRSNSIMRKQVFDVITREGIAELVAIENLSGPGRKRHAWVAISDGEAPS